MAQRIFTSLDEAYLHATEANLATLEELCFLTSSSGSRIRRQRNICLEMLKVCQSTLIDKNPSLWGTGIQPNFSRVQHYLEAAQTRPEDLEGGLEAHIASYTSYRRKG